ncbi:cytochrome P450 [Nocardia panacis]|uniref:Cytochrome P450 n=1 Tax=Nocardia panacis TaxID=2340916 RepID=A0A3A4L0P8_9NOCA|nr:cytochrome P450 [Nocardia panacis]RJO79975.1 cytochrome P450 [Nocardia panacis]
MKPQYLFRWLPAQGVPRCLLRAAARRGEVFAELMGGPRGFADPYPLVEQLRARGRVVRTPISWVSCDHELIRSILRDNRFGVRTIGTYEPPRPLARFAARFPLPPMPVEPPSMLVINPPDHTAMRKPVTSAFTPRAIAKLRDRVETVTRDLLDSLPADGSVDLVRAFSSRLPIAIISGMLGLPDADQDMFLDWGDTTTPLLDVGVSWSSYRRAMAAMEMMDEYLEAHIARLRREPGDDIFSAMVRGGELDDLALKANASLIIGAGFETTVNLIGNGVVQLLAHPDQLARLRAEPDLWPNAVEEILRIDPPVQTTARTALTDIDLADVRIKAGESIVVSLAGANRDPNVFPEPATFDITRRNAKDHLTFSSGIHVCLGASLARMEGAYALRALFTRYPDLRLTSPPRPRPLFTLHGYSQMPVHLGQPTHTPAAA